MANLCPQFQLLKLRQVIESSVKGNEAPLKFTSVI